MKVTLSWGAVCLLMLAGTASADLVTNGGFEAGNFSGWTTTPASSGSLFGVDGNPHSGNFGAFFGGVTAGSYDQIQQTLATMAGQSYNLTFWLTSQGGPPNDFQALVGGVLVHDSLNAGAFPYTQFSDTFTATSSSTVLAFRAYDVPAFFFLDDVSVNPAAVPEPTSVVLLGTVVLSIALVIRRSRTARIRSNP